MALLGEFELIARYFTQPVRRAALGVGDDCALLTVAPGMSLAVSSDMLVEGRHFVSTVAPERLGHKALQKEGIRKVLNSYDVLGGKISFNAIATTAKFRQQNPKTYEAYVAALREATDIINKDKRAAAEAYLRVTRDRMPVDELLAMLNDPNIVITIQPKGADKISEFLAKVGRVKLKPDNWKDYYFGDVEKLKE